MIENDAKLEVEFAILWSSGQWTDSHFEEYDIDLADYDEKDIDCGDPSPAYLDRLCENYEAQLFSKSADHALQCDIAKVVVYQWNWMDEDSI